jgi:hypothetical protein
MNQTAPYLLRGPTFAWPNQSLLPKVTVSGCSSPAAISSLNWLLAVFGPAWTAKGGYSTGSSSNTSAAQTGEHGDLHQSSCLGWAGARRHRHSGLLLRPASARGPRLPDPERNVRGRGCPQATQAYRPHPHGYNSANKRIQSVNKACNAASPAPPPHAGGVANAWRCSRADPVSRPAGGVHLTRTRFCVNQVPILHLNPPIAEDASSK